MKVARFVALMALTAVASTAGAQQGAKGQQKHKAKESLSALAKISKDSATKIALARVPGGRVKSSELEREKGTVVYSFDIAVAGKAGVEEVLVSAIDGSVVSQEHETPKQERAEAAKEKKEQNKKP
jgi:uncharacterized membrane protein YkoI